MSNLDNKSIRIEFSFQYWNYIESPNTFGPERPENEKLQEIALQRAGSGAACAWNDISTKTLHIGENTNETGNQIAFNAIAIFRGY